MIATAELAGRSFDALTDARRAAVMLLGSEVLLAPERDHVAGAVTRIEQAIARKHELGHVDKELEGPRERWPEWDFWREDGEWAAASKDGLCRLRSSSLPALEQQVRRDEDTWARINGRHVPLGERIRFAEANRKARADDWRSNANDLGADPGTAHGSQEVG
jgi:hypothetical protein